MEDITLNSGSERTIKIANSTSTGDNLILKAGKGVNGVAGSGADGAAGGKITISGGAGGDGGSGSSLQNPAGDPGARGDVDITGTNVNITEGTLKANTIKSYTSDSNLILDTATASDDYKIQFNRELISIQNTDLRLTTLSTSSNSPANSIVLTAGGNDNGNAQAKGGSIKLNPGTAPNGLAVDGVIELNGTVTTASPNNLVLQAASGKDVNITGNVINLAATTNVKTSTITTNSGNLTLGAAANQKIEFDEPITSADGKDLILGAATGKVVDITQRVVTRNGIIFYSGSTSFSTNSTISVAALLGGRIEATENITLTLPTANDIISTALPANNLGFRCIFANTTTGADISIAAGTNGTPGTTVFYGYDSGSNSGTNSYNTSMTNKCDIFAGRTVTFTFVRTGSSTVTIYWDGDNVMNLSS